MRGGQLECRGVLDQAVIGSQRLSRGCGGPTELAGAALTSTITTPSVSATVTVICMAAKLVIALLVIGCWLPRRLQSEKKKERCVLIGSSGFVCGPKCSFRKASGAWFGP